jgi:pimeloyl-ACP methyl ester carboxylesterase
MRTERRKIGLFVALLVASFAVLAAAPLSRFARAVEFLKDLAEAPEKPSPAASSHREPRLTEEEVRVPGQDGPIRARLYYPTDRPTGRGIVVAHGVHHAGIDERRLVPFARALARAGHVVLTPELGELADYRITASGVDVIRDSVRYLVAQGDHVEGKRVGLFGFSFAGGLSLVAASDPGVAPNLEFVTSVGGHHDLGRVLRFLVRNRIETPSGTRSEKAHEYGLVVLVYGNLERFVPAPDLPAMRAGVKAWLEEDRPRARRLAAERKTPESDRLWKLLEGGAVQTLAPELEAVLAEKERELGALSPRGRLGRVGVPVYLLHGSHDSVIPPSETDWAALELGSHPHDALVSPLLEHVSVAGESDLGDRLALVRFIANMM